MDQCGTAHKSASVCDIAPKPAGAVRFQALLRAQNGALCEALSRGKSRRKRLG